MSNIIPFDYSGIEVRVVTIDGEPWFIAADVARVLGYANPQKAVRDHCKGVNETVTPSSGGNQRVRIIPESDLYRLIIRSKLPAAERFERWVMEEVLPSIRRTGGFQIPTTYGEALQLAADQQRLIEQQKPAVEFYQAVTSSKDSKTMAEVAKILEMGKGRNHLFRFLREQGILRRNNEPYQKYIDLGWFRVTERKYVTQDGEVHINLQTRVYQKGLDGIRRLLNKEEVA